jgi:hypothetical protein
VTEPSEPKRSRRARRAIARVQEKVGEPVEAAAYVQRWLPFLPVLLLLGTLGDIVFILVARPFYLAATQSQVFLFRAGRVRLSVDERVFDAPLGEVRIEEVRGGPLRRVVRVRRLSGGEHTLAVHRAYWRELERMQSLVDSPG